MKARDLTISDTMVIKLGYRINRILSTPLKTLNNMLAQRMGRHGTLTPFPRSYKPICQSEKR